MKILLGVDSDGHYRSALTLLARLRLQGAELTLLHADEEATFPVALPSTPIFSGAAAPVALRASGYRLLEQAVGEAVSLGFEPRRQYEAGHAIDQILLQAEEMPADLVVIGSRNRNPFLASLLGSTGRGLATHSTQSFLVAHGEVAPAGPVRCVFATDNSIFADTAFERFLQWLPRGISEITVFTAIEPFRSSDQASTENHAVAAAKRCAELSARLQKMMIRSTIRLRIGNVSEEIEEAMKDTRADLLILGARGHGFAERLLLGSVSTHIVDSAKYPVLVLRP